MKQPFVLGYRHVIDRRVPMMHQALGIENPVLISISTVPLPIVVVVFICKADSNSVMIEGEQLLDEAIFQFAIPFPRQKTNNLLASCNELGFARDCPACKPVSTFLGSREFY